MPELPEVETSKRGIAPHIEGQQLKQLIIRNGALRWPIPSNLANDLAQHQLLSISRRGKYMLFNFDSGTVLMHLGMSGSVRILDNSVPVAKHDHFDMVFRNGRILRFNDPRRFGALLWAGDTPFEHPLLAHLGPEPLSEDFSTDYLFARSRGRQVAIKQFIMDSKVVVGVGNIYANESLFLAGINPNRSAGKISKARYKRLVEIIKKVIAKAIEMGGTTLKDFSQADGKPGYFKQHLRVYGRGDEPCENCQKPLKETRHSNRTTVYCVKCQT